METGEIEKEVITRHSHFFKGRGNGRNMKTIQYGVDRETGMVISRMGSEIAVPVLQYERMLPENNFKPQYELEKMDIIAIAQCWNNYKWTKKIPQELKNLHRGFWGMKQLNNKAELLVGGK